MLTSLDVYLHMISVIIILVFAAVYSLLILLSSNVYPMIKLLSILVLIATVYIGVNRNTYLPFLGQTVVPPAVFLQEKVPQGSNVSYVLSLNETAADGTYVLYWGALYSKEGKEGTVRPNPIEAYGDYSNTGIVRVKDNKATLFFNCPDKYNVGSVVPKTLERHIHYRLIRPNDPIMSPVYTAYVNC